MDGNAAGEGDDNVDWNTEDELEVENYAASSSSCLARPSGDAASGSGEVNIWLALEYFLLVLALP